MRSSLTQKPDIFICMISENRIPKMSKWVKYKPKQGTTGSKRQKFLLDPTGKDFAVVSELVTCQIIRSDGIPSDNFSTLLM